jgi:putative DNA primase/helicase
MQAMAARGLEVRQIVGDGKLRRCDAIGRGGKGDGAYVLHLDGLPAGGFQNWRDGLGWENWHVDVGRELTAAERDEFRRKIEAVRTEREADVAQRRAEAAERADAIWRESQPCISHPYLERKGVDPHGAHISRGTLVIPLRDANETLHSLQFIANDGGKKYLSGGRITGCHFVIGKPDKVICVTEGFATGASVHEATGYASVVAFDCGNLLPVAKAIRGKYPDAHIVIAADDDYRTVGNPGITKANESAVAVGGVIAVPDFGPNRPEGATDFNETAA